MLYWFTSAVRDFFKLKLCDTLPARNKIQLRLMLHVKPHCWQTSAESSLMKSFQKKKKKKCTNYSSISHIAASGSWDSDLPLNIHLKVKVSRFWFYSLFVYGSFCQTQPEINHRLSLSSWAEFSWNSDGVPSCSVIWVIVSISTNISLDAGG